MTPGAFEVVALPAVDGPDRLAMAADAGHLIGGRSRTVAALGVAAELALPRGLRDAGALRAAVEWLAAVPVRAGGSGARGGALAVGAFAFDPGAPATLVVPSVAWCSGPEGLWALHVVPAGAEPAGPPVPEAVGAVGAGAGPGSGAGRLAAVPTGDRYAEMVAEALEDIAAGRLSKVVLARGVEVELDPVPGASAVLGRLWGGDPAFLPYSVPVPGGRLVGASPELLISRSGSAIVSHAFAGTVALAGVGDDDAVARLVASVKDRVEHRLVVEEIASALRPRTGRLDVPSEPSVVRLRSDARLGTLVHGELRPDADLRGVDSALGLLAAIHPTPAVGGVPQAAALARIAELEPAPRGYWAGAVGWVDGTGDGEWTLAIRGALLGPGRARLLAGAGVVEGSVPDRERSETGVKLVPVLEALRPGLSQRL